MTRRHPFSCPLRPALALIIVLLATAAASPSDSMVRAGEATALRGTAAAESGQPMGLAAADFDEDGVPDLVVGTSDGWIALHPGRADAIWGFTPDALGRKANGTFDARPFGGAVTRVEIGGPAELLGTGDFNADGHADVVVGQVGATHLGWLAGDGRGQLGPVVAIALPGVVTALAVDDVNRRDGLADVLVGVLSDDGPALFVFEGPDGAFAARPEVIPLAGEVTDLATGWIDDHWAR
ncbi:MAG: VCBS repeat-containing protein, partial [Thermoanaerobaculia bacterium]|nr:VCBS repeat-containing protein [Thermoanaerobaculia bacterium]